MGNGRIVVLGAINIDICGTSNEQLILYDSNQGHSVISFGGVGRNIAENLCRLGHKVDMITVLANDTFTKELVSASESIGISFEHSMHVNNTICSTYISINNSNGDMILGVSDMGIYDLMTVDFIASKIDFLNSADIVIIDANMPAAIIDYVAYNCTAPIVADPVSTTKAIRIRDVLGKFTLIKPNIYESEVLCGIKIDDDESVAKSISYFHNLGVKNVFISLAQEGVAYSDGTNQGRLPIYSQTGVINVSGCGDAFFAAVIDRFLKNCNIYEMGCAGECAAAICAGAEQTISSKLTQEVLDEYLIKYQKQLKADLN